MMLLEILKILNPANFHYTEDSGDSKDLNYTEVKTFQCNSKGVSRDPEDSKDIEHC